jgi:hypothetical protein
MRWPLSAEFQEAIQNPRSCFADFDLKQGKAKEDKLGLPVPISGMFASVYEMTTPSGRWAVRCFSTPISDQQRRYAAISAHLKSAGLQATVGFDYIEQGIRVSGHWYPILKMEWVVGDALNTYIAKNVGQPHRLVQLAKQWVDLMAALRGARISHGDLQHGNILVGSSGIKLIDYDGMYVPALDGLKSHEVGHRNYQHPDRTGHDFGPYTDNFSAWVIFCSITAVSLDPRLWHVSKAGDECLLFRKEDFQNPAQSFVFRSLSSSRPEVQALADQFRHMLAMPLRSIPALDGVIIAASAPARGASNAAKSNTPDWLAGHVAISGNAVPAERIKAADHSVDPEPSITSADWILDHLIDDTPPTQSTAAHSYVPERVAIFVAALCIAFAYLAGVAGRIAPLSSVSSIALLIGMLCWFLSVRYAAVSYAGDRRKAEQVHRSAHRAYQACEQEIKISQQAITKLKAPLDKIKERFDSVTLQPDKPHRDAIAALNTQKKSVTAQLQQLFSEESGALATVDADASRATYQLQLKLNNIDQDNDEELTQALAAYQKKFIDNALANHRINGTGTHIDGIGARITERLMSHGIYTAADVTYKNVRQVEGIGVQKANALMAWRNQIAQQAFAGCLSLPQNVSTLIRDRNSSRKSDLQRQINLLRTGADNRRNEIIAQVQKRRYVFEDAARRVQNDIDRVAQEIQNAYDSERAKIDVEYRAEKIRYAAQAKSYEVKMAEARQRVSQLRFQYVRARRDVDRRKGPSYWAYFARVVGGTRSTKVMP